MEIKQGVHVLPSKKTVGQWGEEWLRTLRLAPSTMASYRKLWRLYITPNIGSVPLDKLTGTMITAMYRKLETGGRHDGKPGQGLSARSIRYCHITVKSSLREAVAQGLLARNPADKAKPPAAREAPPPEIRPWNAQQLATWQAWVDGQQLPDAVALRVLACTGSGAARRSRCVGVTWISRRVRPRSAGSVVRSKTKGGRGRGYDSPIAERVVGS